MFRFRKGAAVVLFVTWVQILWAQGTASMHGTVTDATGASIPDARITATHLGSNLARTVTTDEAGH